MFEKLLYWAMYPAVQAFARLMLKFDVQGDMPDGPKIIASNHPSCTDPFLVPILTAQKVSILITEDAFKVPVFGSYLRRSGHIPVVRGQGRVALEAARRLLDAGRTVSIFPEGRISPREGGMHRGHTGAARLALLTGAPIVPVGIHLLRERLKILSPKIEGEGIDSEWYLRGPYSVTVGEPMQLEGDVEDRERVRALSKALMQRIGELAERSAARMRLAGRWQPVTA